MTIACPPGGSIHDVIIRNCIKNAGRDGEVTVKNYEWADMIPEEMADGNIEVAIGTPSLAVAAKRFCGAGAMLLGSRILDTVGNNITELCVIRAIFVEIIAAVIVHAASILGIPISLGEIVTAAIIGIGCANQGIVATKSDTVKKIVVMWFVSPLFAGAIAYAAIWALV